MFDVLFLRREEKPFFFCSLNPFQAPENSIKVAPVEVASEVCEENVQYKTNMSSPSEPSEASSCKRRDLVSMVTFKYVLFVDFKALG